MPNKGILFMMDRQTIEQELCLVTLFVKRNLLLGMAGELHTCYRSFYVMVKQETPTFFFPLCRPFGP